MKTAVGMKPSEWSASLDAWTIYGAESLGERFARETGLQPCWPTTTVAAVNATLGQTKGVTERVKGPPDEALALGYDVADALADKYALGIARPPQFGRGSRFDAAVRALREAGQ